MALLDDLLTVYAKLQQVSSDCITNGRYTDNARIVAAMTSVSNAIQVEEASDIVAALPNDETLADVKALLAKMNAVAAAIDATATSITNIVQIATGVTNVVVDVSTGKIGDALASVKALLPVLQSVGVNLSA